MMASSTSAQASIIFSRSSAHLALMSAGDLDPLVLLALRLLVEDGGLHGDEIDDALVLSPLRRPATGSAPGVDAEALA